MKRLAIASLVLIAFALPLAGQPKYGVTVTTDKKTDFKTIKSYVWQSGWDANDPKVHKYIVTAVDKELKALGLQVKPSGPADVIVKYAALRRIDVEVSMTASSEAPRRQVDVGSLVIVMLDPGTTAEKLRIRLDKPIEVDPDKVESAISAAVAEIFAKYPTRAK